MGLTDGNQCDGLQLRCSNCGMSSLKGKKGQTRSSHQVSRRRGKTTCQFEARPREARPRKAEASGRSPGHLCGDRSNRDRQGQSTPISPTLISLEDSSREVLGVWWSSSAKPSRHMGAAKGERAIQLQFRSLVPVEVQCACKHGPWPS